MRDLYGTKTVLLGPQRLAPNVGDALARLGIGDGPVAAITAGWEEREAEDLELGRHLRRPVDNLGLQERAEALFREDPGLHDALRETRDRLRELQRLYRVRLRYLGPAAEDLLRREGPADLLEPERQAAMDQLRDLDEHNLRRVREIEDELRERLRLAEHPRLDAHRRDLAARLARAEALLIAGGHVGILYNRLWLFDVLDLVPAALPVIAWSAGAMALAERVVLFHDMPPQGRGFAEVFGPGLGLCRGVVPLPHASERIRLDDPVRVQLLARRFPDALCAALDADSELVWDGNAWRGAGTARRLLADGTVEDLGEEREGASR